MASVLVQGKGWDDGGYGGYGKARALRGRFFLGQLSLAVAVLNKHQPVSITMNNPSTWVFLRLTCCGDIFLRPFVASIPGARAASPSMMEATCGRRCDFL